MRCRLGVWMASGDVDGDGSADVVISAAALGTLRNAYDRQGGAGAGPDNSRTNSGEMYVVFRRFERPVHIDLSGDPPAALLVIYGAEGGGSSPDRLGEEVVLADVNGDGYADMFVGVPGDEGPLDRFFSGGIAIIAGGPDLPAEIDLWAPQVPVVWVKAPDPLDFAAYWSAIGDLDGDGRIDAIPNGMAGDGPANRRDGTGEAHVVSGLALAQYLPGEAVTAVGEAAVVPGGRAVVSRLSQSL